MKKYFYTAVVFCLVVISLIVFSGVPDLWASHSTDPATGCAEYGGTWDGSTCQMPTNTSTTDPATSCTQHGGTWNGSTCQMPTTTSSPTPTPTYSPYPSPTSSPMPTGFYVDYEQTSPKNNESGISADVTIKVRFTQELDPNSTLSQFFTLANIAAYDQYIAGTFQILSKGFDFKPNTGLEIGKTYMYRVLTGLKDKNGNMLAYEFGSSFSTGALAAGKGMMSGKVTDAGGLPVSGASVNLQTADYSFWRGAQTDSQGLYKISDIPAGTYTINIYPPPNNTGLISPPSATITFSADQAVAKDFAFAKAVKKISGTVTYPDGRAVSDASIGLFKKDTGGWAEGRTDGSGRYSVALSGGSWDVSVYPYSPMANWSYNRPPETVSFAQDENPEEKVMNFVVTLVDATITGKLVKPDGSPPTKDSVFMSFRSGEGAEFGGPVDSSGNFMARLVAGSYNVFVYSQDPNFSGPALPQVSVASGETKNLGTITLVAKNEHIKGRVSDKGGVGLANIQVDAYIPSGGSDYATTKTDSSGAYDLRVTPGNWEVMPRPDITSNYYNPSPPKSVTVTAGGTATADFVLAFADSGVSGTVVDGQGNTLSDVYGYVNLMTGTQFIGSGGSGGPIERGNFSIKAPAGTYKLGVFLSPDSPYTPGLPQSVTITSGQTLTVKVTVSKNASIITGYLKDESGKIITGVQARAFATAGVVDAWQEGLVDKATGKYKIRIAPGTWYLGYDIDPASGYMSAANPTLKVTVAENQTVTQDIVVIKANSVITGKVTDPSGQGVANVFVAVSRKSFGFQSIVSEGADYEEAFVAEADTDSAGSYRINVSAGTYFVKTFINPELGLLSAAEQQVTVADTETKTANFVLRKGELTITGKIMLGDTPTGGAFVWGWSDKGGYQETMSSADGSYVLNITGSESWRVGAAKEINDAFYKSSEIEVKVGTENVTQNINLTKVADLPPPTVQTADATAPVVVSVGGGPTVSAPANSISTSGTISINITPDTRVPSQGDIKVIGVAYEMEARDSSGQAVTSFNTGVVVSMPYQDTEITKLGINEDELAIAFWSESAGTWKNLDDCLVNKIGNDVTCTTDHFTRFALVAAADITPPSPPTLVKAVALGSGMIKITWVNPAKDFSHAKIYRSESSASLGKLVAAEAPGTEYTDDQDLKTGITYYYVVRAVDPAGNETSNTDSISVKAIGTSVKSAPSSVLKEGDVISASGSDDPDVYIINEHGYKRLFLNPVIFGFYGHLGGFSKVKTILPAARDAYKTSGLFRNCETNDPKVYGVEVTGEDTGALHWVNTSGEQAAADDPDFFKKTFCINNNEFSWYKKSSAYNSVNQIPSYSR